ncbi:hypothetical protein DLM46_17075 [Paraburkholderia lacunae]|uniref:Uncharacterized protein n=1 Tax=Paraburkholderia lacunae TaxID=2211104 RepID=A0A370N7E2_9BURK|nr:hypothetical protein DLM46_17075 [Paraburkholderia lacunae]
MSERDTKLHLYLRRAGFAKRGTSEAQARAPARHALRSLYNRALAAVALHHTGRTSLNRNFGAAIMPARFSSVLFDTVEEHP